MGEGEGIYNKINTIKESKNRLCALLRDGAQSAIDSFDGVNTELAKEDRFLNTSRIKDSCEGAIRSICMHIDKVVIEIYTYSPELERYTSPEKFGDPLCGNCEHEYEEDKNVQTCGNSCAPCFICKHTFTGKPVPLSIKEDYFGKE